MGPDFGAYKPLVRLPDHTDQVTSVTFSADGNRLATVAADKKTRIWDMSSLNEYLKLREKVENIQREIKANPDYSKDASRLGLAGLVEELEKFLERHKRSGTQ